VSVTEILVVGGQRFRVQGTPEEVEAKILNAARGSILELVWLVESASQRSVALNPAHVVAVGDAQPRERAPSRTDRPG
jgi:hypothetical protein